MRLSSAWQVFSANSKQERSGKSRESKVRLKQTASSMQRSVECRKKGVRHSRKSRVQLGKSCAIGGQSRVQVERMRR